MKVLFAVSNEEISESIVKKYQNEYKQIISYKNVYYFNAILKEIQKDKTYDRIVISEDLEAFSHTQYDQIDKFIFDKLDSISDEASTMKGDDTPIILICSDRRTKAEQILVKLFGIGVYNALIGQDRSVEDVCKLINKPRTKKEAKLYYKIDSEDVSYKAEKEEDVNEVEIQNILMHYRRLGKDETKYVESFDNIAAQYSDNQLRIISKFLPLNVKAVLEEKSPKYQKIMSFNNSVSNTIRQKKEENEGPSARLLNTKTKAMPMSKPVVIPSAVNMGNVKKLAKNKRIVQPQQNQMPNGQPQRFQQAPMQNGYGNQMSGQPMNGQPMNGQPQQYNTQMQRPTQQSHPSMLQQPEQPQQVRQPMNGQSQRVQQPPRMQQSQPIRQEPTQSVEPQIQKVEPVLEEPVNSNQYKLQERQGNEPLAELEKEMMQMAGETEVEEVKEVKRRRGRPRKNPVQTEEVNKPKRGRGRPRKADIENTVEEDNANILPGFENDNVEDDANILPGFNDNAENNSNMLPGFENEVEDNTNILPGFENDNVEDNSNMLPGFEDETEDNSGMLPGFEDNNTQSYQDNTSGMLPGFEDNNTQSYQDNTSGMLPGFEDNNTQTTYQDNSSTDMYSGFDNNSQQQNSYDMNNQYQNSNSYDMNNDNPYGDSTLQTSPYQVENDMNQNTGYGFNTTSTSAPEYNNDTSYNTYSTGTNTKSNGINSEYVNTVDLSGLLTPDKKVAAFVGTSKNGTSFIVNNVAELASSMGISTAILDTTKNRNSYYIYTKNEEQLRTTAAATLDNLIAGTAAGIVANKNLTVFTSLPDGTDKINKVDEILETLIKNYQLVLIDTDFDTSIGYFKQAQEIYLVQTYDILTIQPLTAFLRELKAKNALEESKLRIVLNKSVKVRGISEKTIIGGMAFYNDPAMSFMTELFDRNMIKYVSIPFEDETYIKYLENIINCEVSLKGYSKVFMQSLRYLTNVIYPLVSGNAGGGATQQTYRPPSAGYTTGTNGFSPSINTTLNQMKRNY